MMTTSNEHNNAPAVPQGWPEFMELAGKFSCVQMQEALADGVPRGLADAWIHKIEATGATHEPSKS